MFFGECHLIRMIGHLMLFFVCSLHLIGIIIFIVILYKLTITLIEKNICLFYKTDDGSILSSPKCVCYDSH